MSLGVRALGLGLLLAGCGGGDPAPEPSPLAAATPAARATPSRQIGQVSALEGTTSGLTGQVSGFQVSVTDTATVVQLAADTLFAFDEADLDPAAEANLRRTADLVRQGGNGTVSVIGHTDAKGDDAYNLGLSRRRAQAVATWLGTQPGFAGRTFAAEGVGEIEPVAPNTRPDGSDDPDGRARNRRWWSSSPAPDRRRPHVRGPPQHRRGPVRARDRARPRHRRLCA